jgi:uncharacterized protein involved in response to NO
MPGRPSTLTCINAARAPRRDTGAMNATAAPSPAPAHLSPRLLLAAPHRLLFFVGAANVLAAMVWWAAWLVGARWGLLPMPQASIPPGWAHAIVMPYLVLAPFMFGFLLTVFPRWTNQPALDVWHYVPVGAGLLGGQLLLLAGLWGAPHLVHLGLLFALAGWTAGLAFLAGVVWREEGRTWHALSCLAALGFGWLGLLLFVLWLHTGEARLAFAAIKLGMLGFALPLYLTVVHRMVPFFASCVIPGYRPWRPMALLAAAWAGLLVHLGLELAHGYAWLWPVDGALALLFAVMLWRWWPRAPMPGILRVLFLGTLWLPIAFALFALQSAWFAYSGEFALGRAPLHALAVGFFGSLLVAMVTRVTQGHSGRPLAMTATAWFAFVVIQVVTLTRLAADFGSDPLAINAIAALGWVLAFTPWVLASCRIYLARRADGRPG